MSLSHLSIISVAAKLSPLYIETYCNGFKSIRMMTLNLYLNVGFLRQCLRR